MRLHVLEIGGSRMPLAHKSYIEGHSYFTMYMNSARGPFSYSVEDLLAYAETPGWIEWLSSLELDDPAFDAGAALRKMRPSIDPVVAGI